MPASSESTSASHDASMTFSCTPIAPQVDVAVGRVEQHARRRAGRLPLVEDADLVVDELDVAQVRQALADRGAQRAVQGMHGAVALGGAHEALRADPELDRRLGLHAPVGALLGDHAPGLELEQRLVLARLAPDQQLEGAVGGLELEAAVLELLDALDHPRGGRVVQVAARVRDHGALAGQLAHEHLARVADRGRVDVLERQRVGVDARDVHPALVRERVLAHVGLVGVGREVEHLRDQVRGLGQPLQRRQARVAHLQLQVRDDRDQVRVAAALAVAVHRALDQHGALGDRRQRVRDRALGVVVGVDAQRGVRQRAPHDVHRLGDLRAAATRRWCRTSSGSRRPRPAPRAGTRSRTPGRRGSRRRSARRRRPRACRTPPGTRPTRRSSAGSRRGRP